MGFYDFVYGLLGWRILAAEKIGGKDVVAVKKKGRRELVYDHVIHSMLRDDSIYTRHYWDYALPLPSIFRDPRVLVIGLGGGTIPYQMRKLFGKGISIEVVEADKRMLRLSRAFLPEKLEAKITIGDGRSYLARRKGEYSLIIADPYIGGEIPGGFFSGDFIGDAYEALKPDGVLAINYALTVRAVSQRPRLLAKLRGRFKVFSVHYPGSIGNVIFVCSKKYGAGEISSRVGKNFPRTPENSFLFRAYAKMR